MMKKLFFLIFPFLLLSCGDDDAVENVSVENEVNDFVWRSMNLWYYWQNEKDVLKDNHFSNLDELNNYLNGFSNPEGLFNQVLYQPNSVDRFSWFIDNYVEQENSFQGITTSYGFSFRGVRAGTDDNDAVIFIRYVTPNSPAANAGFKRGQLITHVDGIDLTAANYSEVVGEIFNTETHSFGFSTFKNSVFEFVESKTITAIQLTTNPVHYHKIIENINGKKVGYLVYNGFRFTFNSELNQVFAEFKAAGIDELILDLRYNGGGSVETSSYLASMINESTGQDIFATLEFNNKTSNNNSTYNFTNTLNVYQTGSSQAVRQETINRLSNLNQLYVLTTEGTASASEMIINGLIPFMTVKVIGETTYGKNVGSATLYDSPSSNYTSKTNVNPNHLNAIQPIIFKIFNNAGNSDYTNGFSPNIEIIEKDYWNNILPFGDENELLLKAALDDIRGIATSRFSRNNDLNRVQVQGLKEITRDKFDKEMYIHPQENQ